jgi:hypothetical protein
MPDAVPAAPAVPAVPAVPAEPGAASSGEEHAFHAGHAPHDAPTACANCGVAFAPGSAPRFCPSCGQETTLHPPSVGEFLHEFVGHYVALEGALWKTLGLLVLRPGRLTREYFAGRRRRYVLPLRLYLSASFLFFLTVKLLPSISPMNVVVAVPRAHVAHVAHAASGASAPATSNAAAAASAPGAPVASGKEDDAEFIGSDGRPVHLDPEAAAQVREAQLRAASSPYAAYVRRDCSVHAPGQSDCGWFQRRVVHANAEWRDDPQGAVRAFQAHWVSAAPYAIFLMLPVFAAIVMGAYRNRHMLFGEHVVFSLHMHAFWFLAAWIDALLPDDVGGFVFLGVLVYSVWALHEVYGGRWFATVLRAIAISIGYGLLVTLGSGLLAVGLLLA